MICRFAFVVIIIALNLIIVSCAPNEPDEKYIKKQFSQNHKNDKFIECKNTEVSPPCFYWNVTYKDSLENIKTEKWQFWDVDSINNNWRLVIL